MIRSLASSLIFSCAILLGTFSAPATALAEHGKSTGRFHRDGVITAIGLGSITVTHDDGQEIDYSTSALNGGDDGSVIVKGRLPLSFVGPGMVLRVFAKMSPMGKVQEAADEVAYVNDQTEELDLERTDDQGIYEIVGKVIRVTGSGMLLQVPKSRLAKQGRVELATKDDAQIVFDMPTLDRVAVEDTVQSMMGATYEGGVNVITEITIELSPHRKQKAKPLTRTDQLLQKYAYLSDENMDRPRKVKLKHFNLHTDISPLQTKVLGMKLDSMHDVVYRYLKKCPQQRIECKIVADATNWVNAPNLPQAQVDSGDDHDEVLQAAYHAFCKSTFGGGGPKWYCDGMSLMANYWELKDKKVSVDPEIVAYLKSNPTMTLASAISDSNFGSDDSCKNKAASWALCCMMIHNANYSKEFRTLGINMMKGQPDSFELRFQDQMAEINFEYRQFLKNLEIGYRPDLCQWNWKVTPKKLFGADMVSTNVNSRAGWQATKVEVVAQQTYEYVAQGQWQTNPQSEASTASGADGQGRLIGTIFSDYRLSQPILLGERGTFVAQTDGQLFLRCDDRWNQIEDNKGRLKVFVRKAQ